MVGQPSVQEQEQEEARKRQEMEEVLGKHKSRRAGVAKMKRKYGLSGAGGQVEVAPGYADRAEGRRREVGVLGSCFISYYCSCRLVAPAQGRRRRLPLWTQN